jgi:hypothetical protein
MSATITTAEVQKEIDRLKKQSELDLDKLFGQKRSRSLAGQQRTDKKGKYGRGVTKARTRYYAEAQYENRRIKRGPFNTAAEAQKAYDNIVTKIYGNRAKTNFPQSIK